MFSVLHKTLKISQLSFQVIEAGGTHAYIMLVDKVQQRSAIKQS